MEKSDWWLIGFGALVMVLMLCFVTATFTGDKTTIYTTYEEGFEISHMETAGKHFIISARNDNDSFSIAVDSATYAKFIINDIIHVKVTVYEQDGHYYNKYEILGREG